MAKRQAEAGKRSFRILGIGSCLPDRVVTNDELGPLIDLSPDRIKQLFDVEQRHWCRGLEDQASPTGQAGSDLAKMAAEAAIADAGVEVEEIDGIVCGTMTPDYVSPPMDYLVASKLGMAKVLGATVHAPCSSMFRALSIAQGWLECGRVKRVLVTVSEATSPMFRLSTTAPKDHRLTAALFADGAGAMIVSLEDCGKPTGFALFAEIATRDDKPGILSPGLLSVIPPTPENASGLEYLGYHDFSRVLRHGSKLVRAAADRVLCDAGASMGEVRFFIMHQATGGLKRHCDSVGLPSACVPVNIQRVGNTIGASILILLDELYRGGELTAGDLLVLHTAESASWGYAGMAIRW